MKETVHFTKMQGAGNDYIYVDTQQYDIPDPEKAAIAWSAYHTGIGSDGLVLIGKPHDGRSLRKRIDPKGHHPTGNTFGYQDIETSSSG